MSWFPEHGPNKEELRMAALWCGLPSNLIVTQATLIEITVTEMGEAGPILPQRIIVHLGHCILSEFRGVDEEKI